MKRQKALGQKALGQKVLSKIKIDTFFLFASTVCISAAARSLSIRLRDLDLQFETVATAVAEPSSLALVAGFGLVGLRRRCIK